MLEHFSISKGTNFLLQQICILQLASFYYAQPSLIYEKQFLFGFYFFSSLYTVGTQKTRLVWYAMAQCFGLNNDTKFKGRCLVALFATNLGKH